MKLCDTVYWVNKIRHFHTDEYRIRKGYIINFDSETVVLITFNDRINTYVPCIRAVNTVSLECPNVHLWADGIPERYKDIVSHA